MAEDVIVDPAPTFYKLYDLSIDELEAYNTYLSNEVSLLAWALTGGPTNEIPRHE